MASRRFGAKLNTERAEVLLRPGVEGVDNIGKAAVVEAAVRGKDGGGARGDAVAAVPSLCVSLLVGSRKTSRPIALAACRRVTALRSSPLFRKPLHGKLTQAAAQLVLPSAEVGRTLS